MFVAKPGSMGRLYEHLFNIVSNARPIVRSQLYVGPNRRIRQIGEHKGRERHKNRVKQSGHDRLA